jgi:hypothetical protein
MAYGFSHLWVGDKSGGGGGPCWRRCRGGAGMICHRARRLLGRNSSCRRPVASRGGGGVTWLISGPLARAGGPRGSQCRRRGLSYLLRERVAVAGSCSGAALGGVAASAAARRGPRKSPEPDRATGEVGAGRRPAGENALACGGSVRKHPHGRRWFLSVRVIERMGVSVYLVDLSRPENPAPGAGSSGVLFGGAVARRRGRMNHGWPNRRQ